MKPKNEGINKAAVTQWAGFTFLLAMTESRDSGTCTLFLLTDSRDLGTVAG